MIGELGRGTVGDALRPLRILLVIDDLHRGGAQAVVLSTLRLADHTRLDLRVATISDPVDPGLGREVARASGSPVAVIGARGLWDVRAVGRLVSLVRRARIDLVHTHLAHADVLGGIAARLTRRPVVSTLHAVAADRATMPRRRRVAAAAATRYLSGPLVAVSEAVRASHVDALRIDESRVVVLRNVPAAPILLPAEFDPTAWRAEQRLGPGPIIASAARLALPKDHATLLRALPAVLARHPDALLVIAGGGPLADELSRLARSLSIEHAVRFLGVRDDVPQLLCAADIVCNLTHEAEGLSITVLDAMSLGRPVIATGVESVREVILDGDRGVIVAPRDVEAVTAALVALLDDPQRRRQIGAAARAYCSAHLEPRRWMGELERVYAAAATETRA